MNSPTSDRRIFVETSVYFAAVDRRDASHAAIAATMRRLLAENQRFITTSAVLFEVNGFAGEDGGGVLVYEVVAWFTYLDITKSLDSQSPATIR